MLPHLGEFEVDREAGGGTLPLEADVFSNPWNGFLIDLEHCPVR